MVHERVPRVLYEHPIVEYIPLEVTDLETGPLSTQPAAAGAPTDTAAGAVVRPALFVLNSAHAWEDALAHCGPAVPALQRLRFSRAEADAHRQLPVLAVGFRVAAGIYRGRKVSLATSDVRPLYHLFTLPLKYFYKPEIDFVAYTSLGIQLAETRNVNVGLQARGSSR